MDSLCALITALAPTLISVLLNVLKTDYKSCDVSKHRTTGGRSSAITLQPPA